MRYINGYIMRYIYALHKWLPFMRYIYALHKQKCVLQVTLPG